MLTNTNGYDNLKSYVFGEVKRNWRRNGQLNKAEFYAIIKWKAWRVVSKIPKRFDVEWFTRNLYQLRGNTAGLKKFLFQNRRLIKRGMDLPIFSAFLSVLRPEVFPVIDIRIMRQLGSRLGRTWVPSGKHRIWYFDYYCKAMKRIMREDGFENLRALDKHYWYKDEYEDQIATINERAGNE